MQTASASENLSVGEAAQLEKLLQRGPNLLCFPPRLESIFRRYYLIRNRGRMLLSLLIGMLFYLGFFLFDRQLLDDPSAALALRFGLVLPAAVVLAFVLALARHDWQAQLAYALGLCIAAGALLLISYRLRADIEPIYIAALLLILMYVYVFAALRLIYAATAGLAITVAVLVWMWWHAYFDSTMLSVWGATMLAANVMGIYGAFTIETCIRQDFLRNRLLTARRLNLEDANRLLRDMAERDELTGLANRRKFRDRMTEEWLRCRRESKPLTLILIDVDAFKPYNDSLGHQQGDRCLEDLAEVIGSYARRPGDTAARYGGEEFALLLSDCSRDNAVRIAENIREEIAELRIPHPASPVAEYVTISLGAGAVIPGNNNGVEGFFESVDQALYRAKHAGRNRVVAGESGPASS